MAKFPNIPNQGRPIMAQDVADIVRYVRAISPVGDGKSITVKNTDGGALISSRATVTMPIILTERTGVDEYLCDVYENGFDNNATQTDQTVYLIEPLRVSNAGYEEIPLNLTECMFLASYQPVEVGGVVVSALTVYIPQEYRYNNYFRCYINSSDNIVINAGLAVINNEQFVIAESTIAKAAMIEGEVIYIEATYTPAIVVTDEYGERSVGTPGVTNTPTVNSASSLPVDDRETINIPIAIVHFNGEDYISDIEQLQHGAIIQNHIQFTIDEKISDEIDEENAEQEDDSADKAKKDAQDSEAASYCSGEAAVEDNAECVAVPANRGVFDSYEECSDGVDYGDTCADQGYGDECGKYIFPCTQREDGKWEFSGYRCCDKKSPVTDPVVNNYYLFKNCCYDTNACDTWVNVRPGDLDDCCLMLIMRYDADDKFRGVYPGGYALTLDYGDINNCIDSSSHDSVCTGAVYTKWIFVSQSTTQAALETYQQSFSCHGYNDNVSITATIGGGQGV